MNRRRCAILLMAGAVLMLPAAYASPQGNSGNHGHGHDKGDGDDQDHGKGNGHGNDKGNGNGNANGHYKHQQQRYFRDQDSSYLVRYYDGPRNLPPGLRKKYYRNGTLPPGWQSRFRPLPPAALVQLPPVPYGYERGYYDGYAVVVDPRTRVIVDVVDIVGALSGH